MGCPKNLVDSEVVLGVLQGSGYRIVPEPEEADVLMVNTCGFIKPAVEESIETILGLVQIKNGHLGQKLVVFGCLPQRYGRDLAKELPEVDLFLGTDELALIAVKLAALETDAPPPPISPGPRFLMNASMPRLISTPAHRSYLKITEGCANNCSYCLIPKIRGRLRSRPIDDLVAEARRLESSGVKELTLVGQDLTTYGLDLGEKVSLPALLAALLEGCTIPWIRPLYLHPVRVDDALLRMIGSDPRIMPYLDIPLQHVNSRILQAMNRPYDRAYIDLLLGRVREILPQAAIRTTFMVGFPGEDEAAFAELMAFVEQNRLDHVGVFPYSNEEGCAAEKLPGQLLERVKEKRQARIMKLQQAISRTHKQSLIGKRQQVLVEGVSGETELLLEGRTRFQAPEIDGVVYITSGLAMAGDIVDVTITEAFEYDLAGEIVL